jgi:uncharacterized protein YdeI (YjbR/CyaY-like superfamily)
MSLDSAKEFEAASVQALHDWLTRHHEQTESVWLVTFKKSSGSKYISTSEVLDELVSFGWTDGIRAQVDDQRTKQLISPRRTKPWAKSYKDRAERLIEQGRMHPAGQAAVDLAKETGAWDQLNDVDALIVPPDLLAGLMSQSAAWANFEAFPPSTRRNILRWIASAKTEGTRLKRIERICVDAEKDVRTPVNG